ncbi:potassium channel family protein [Amycolatopsis sp. YIM 10]|uniref:potassium channel family protein n=1 Tax=Amycolatopsis sp. YIM 10 TaxID=2653857 RepID=UPI001290294D|nr:potassium channel family protein [Amycolatopsis sp. YIM 10]QFU88938.1 voltage-gated potassium channel [Amycolatopsis sp. YIM 10]
MPVVPRWPDVALALVRPLVTTALLLTGYYLLPVDRGLSGWHAVGLIAGLCLVIAVVAWQARLISHAKHPALQGIQALALSAPLFLLLFANLYHLLSYNLPPSFTEPLTRTDALYFTVTVFATVGFGDIAPVSQTARVLVTVQMAGNLLVLGAALRVIVTAVRRRRAQE